jgi:hypothetical protein
MEWNFIFVKYGEAKSKPKRENLIVTVLYKICFIGLKQGAFFYRNLIVIEMHNNMTL